MPALIFRKYEPSDLEPLRNVFFSNIPPYFEKAEWDDFEDFLKNDIVGDCYYDVAVLDGQVVGAGGIALNEDGTVSLCWGMIDKTQHKKGFGIQLLEHRLRWAESTFPGHPVTLSTSQHTDGFLKNTGLSLQRWSKIYGLKDFMDIK